jgi:YVTN family beta-propeller protein
VTVIDVATGTASAPIPVTALGTLSHAVTPDGSKLYVAGVGANKVTVIDTATDTVVTTLTVGNNPAAVAVRSDGLRA